MLAVKFAIGLKKKKIIIFSDSLSSIVSIENCLKLNGMEIETIIHWIPAHIGVINHDIADKAAKNATNAINIDLLPLNEIIDKVKSTNMSHWETEYNDITQNKGLFYKNIIDGKLRLSPWFKNQGYKNKTIKLINRLRGHSFDKHTLHRMKIEQTNLCDTCNVVENAEHVITKCIKFNSIRSKYKLLYLFDFKNILRNPNAYSEIESYLNEIQYPL